MALLTTKDIRSGLERLGALALAEGLELRLGLVGGAVMALAYKTRFSTRDVPYSLPRLKPPMCAVWLRLWRLSVAGPKTG